MSEEQGPLALYEVRDGVAFVTMNRPRYRNAQNAKLTYALDDAYTKAIQDDAVKVIVLAGAGKHFSAGHDIGTPGRDIEGPFERRATPPTCLRRCTRRATPGRHRTKRPHTTRADVDCNNDASHSHTQHTHTLTRTCSAAAARAAFDSAIERAMRFT